MKQVIILCLFFHYCFIELSAQSNSNFLVYFTDKGQTSYSLARPSDFLSSRALDRRNRQNLTIDSLDLPVHQQYIDLVLSQGPIRFLGRSKWLNAILVETNNPSLRTEIEQLPFVKNTVDWSFRRSGVFRLQPKNKVAVIPYAPLLSHRRTESLSAPLNYGASFQQINLHNGTFLHRLGATGTGMSIAFMDAGYQGYLSNRFLEDALNNNRIPITYDFIANNPSVNENNAHGLFCLSIVAAHTPGVFIGTAPDASFYLLRTENENSEYPIEEFFWGIGAEFADSCGADVISSSVGYSTFDNNSYNHSYPELNGKTTLITKMANMAFRKGILVVNSAGNEGSTSWKYMLAPADSDSVLTVGAVNSTGTIASLSSFGPTYDKRIKPDALAIGIGTVLSSSNGELSAGTGTSFACPIIAGLATCLWQLFPETTNRQILEAIRKSGNRYAAPEAQYGFGIPDMKKAVALLLQQTATISLSSTECVTTINWKSKDNATMHYAIERRLPGEINFTTIAVVAGTGDEFEQHQYQIEDQLPGTPSGYIDYRIRQTIDTGATTFFSELICAGRVLSQRNCNGRLTLVYPNPALESFTIALSKDAPATNLEIEVYQSNGALFKTYSYATVANYRLPIDGANWPKGIYTLKIKHKARILGTERIVLR